MMNRLGLRLGRGQRRCGFNNARLGRNRNPECPFYRARWGK